MATFNLTTGPDTISGTSADDTVNGTSATLNAADRLDGGGGHNTLALSGPGNFDLNALAQFTNFQEVDVTNTTGGTVTLNYSNSGKGPTNTLTVKVSNTASGDSATTTTTTTSISVTDPTAGTGNGGTTLTDSTTPSPDSPLQRIEQHVSSILSNLQDFPHGDGLTQLLNQIGNWNSPTGSLTPATNGQTAQYSLSSSLDWPSQMIQTMASFGNSKGGPSPGLLIQTNDQVQQTVLAGSTQHS